MMNQEYLLILLMPKVLKRCAWALRGASMNTQRHDRVF